MAGWALRADGDPPVILRILAGHTKTIGRTARADFILDAPLVSRVHCRLTADESGQLVAEDLDSTNGIMVNGERVERRVLRLGDVLTVGRVDLAVHVGD
jgi:pSer/pThr/pTyr-binding forkhead associated (FHA) protein